MKLLNTVLLLTFSFLLSSCGSSPDPKTECTELMKLTMVTTKILAKKMPGNMGKSMIANMEKKETQDELMKKCMTATPERRARETRKLKALL